MTGSGIFSTSIPTPFPLLLPDRHPPRPHPIPHPIVHHKHPPYPPPPPHPHPLPPVMQTGRTGVYVITASLKPQYSPHLSILAVAHCYTTGGESWWVLGMQKQGRIRGYWLTHEWVKCKAEVGGGLGKTQDECGCCEYILTIIVDVSSKEVILGTHPLIPNGWKWRQGGGG